MRIRLSISSEFCRLVGKTVRRGGRPGGCRGAEDELNAAMPELEIPKSGFNLRLS